MWRVLGRLKSFNPRKYDPKPSRLCLERFQDSMTSDPFVQYVICILWHLALQANSSHILCRGSLEVYGDVGFWLNKRRGIVGCSSESDRTIWPRNQKPQFLDEPTWYLEEVKKKFNWGHFRPQTLLFLLESAIKGTPCVNLAKYSPGMIVL